MHEYLMEVGHYFRGTVRFQVCALNKADAIVRGNEYVRLLHDDNYIKGTVKCVKKLKPSFGKEN